jgi:Kef-type K+ transport system membrane component KefB
MCQCSDYFGLSLELGSFLAGVMISTTDFAHHTLEQVLFCILESTVFLFFLPPLLTFIKSWADLLFCFFKVEAIRNLFAALFLASIGMLIHIKFLWNHVDILLAAVILVIIVKSIVVTVVVKAFGYGIRTAFVVSITTVVVVYQYFAVMNVFSLLLFLSHPGCPLLSSDWRVCFCALEPCFPSSPCWGALFSFHCPCFLPNILP